MHHESLIQYRGWDLGFPFATDWKTFIQVKHLGESLFSGTEFARSLLSKLKNSGNPNHSGIAEGFIRL